MFKHFTPYAHAINLYDIEIKFYKKHNFNTCLLDLDNTLDSYKTSIPSDRAIKYITELKNNKIRPIIISNNTGNRVSTYANKLGIEYFHSIGKPFSKKLLKKLKELNIEINNVIIIGDQLVTDISCANNAQIKSILTEKLVKEDQFTTHFNRIIDKPIRRYLKKRNKLIDWRKTL